MLTCYENTRVFTADAKAADCFVVCDDRFVFAGQAADAHAAYPDADRVDLKGLFVCPGFNDSHMHLLELGCVLTQAQLQHHTGSLEQVMLAVDQFAAEHPQEDWILGRGWNHDFFTDENRFPTREDLDAVCPDRPCLITRACGHVAIANSCALRLCGIDHAAPCVSGGTVRCGADGRPNGILEENAIALVSARIPAPDREGIKRRLLLAMETVASFGITSVQSDDFGALEVPFEEVILAYQELKSEGRMTVRVYEQCLLPTQELLERFLRAGYHTGWGDDFFRLGPLKLLTDGSLGARTAYLRAPYSDAPDSCGTAIYTQEALDSIVLTAHQAGMQIAAHAIGDGAAEAVLQAIERAQAAYPRNDARHGIVHAQILTSAQAERMSRLGMHAYIQPIFLDYDTQIVFPRIGDRALDAYPAASFSRLGVTFSGGSDCPVEPCDVMKGLQCAVTRKSVTRPAEHPYLPHEALPLSKAISCFTRDGAYASFEENVKGWIAAGYYADFTLLGIDPFETDPSWIHKIPIHAVYTGGKKVF
ncbi:MAG: amidohydrolase family protein [Clostridia bacterium]|nr:amidohydrolase family protein [Clostridia bacterium]